MISDSQAQSITKLVLVLFCFFTKFLVLFHLHNSWASEKDPNFFFFFFKVTFLEFYFCLFHPLSNMHTQRRQYTHHTSHTHDTQSVQTYETQ